MGSHSVGQSNKIIQKGNILRRNGVNLLILNVKHHMISSQCVKRDCGHHVKDEMDLANNFQDKHLAILTEVSC